MSEIILNLLIVFIIQSQLHLVYAQNVCQKVDFNRDTSELNEFHQCVGEASIVLKINSYTATTIVPFRPTSAFHLSATDIGLSCLQSTRIFTLDNNSEIRTAIFLTWDIVGAWVEIRILDENGELVDVAARLEESNGWTSFYGKLNRSIENAQIEIRANMNAASQLAIEYVYVLNSDSIDDECIDIDTDPPVTDEPTDEPTEDPSTGEPTEVSTDEPTDDPTDDPTDEPTDEPTDVPTDDPTEEPTESSTVNDSSTNTDPSMTTSDTTMTTPQEPIHTSQSNVYVWMSLSILFFITTIATLIGIYYLILSYRKVMTTLPITPPNVKTMTNLPRLTVANSVNGNQVIIGMDKQQKT